MFDYIKGKITEINPAYVVVETNNIGYFINISISTYSQIHNKSEVFLYLYQIIREDAHLLYGFFTKQEREIFKNLISVSGIGANTARMILSSYPYQEIQRAIINEDINFLQSIKGIGTKTAQRIVVELKDKLSRETATTEIFKVASNTLKNDALLALSSLGFQKSMAEKVVSKILSTEPEISIEELIKKALKYL